MQKVTFKSEKGPKPVGPYSSAAWFGDIAFLSGIIPVDPQTGEHPEGIEEQARRALNNAGIVLAEMGLTFADALKTTVFLTDMADFKAVNAIYAEYFGPDYPARSCVAVSALPMGVKLEIEIVAGRQAR